MIFNPSITVLAFNWIVIKKFWKVGKSLARSHRDDSQERISQIDFGPHTLSLFSQMSCLSVFPCLQCDQKLKLLGNKFDYKSSPNVWWRFGQLWKPLLFKSNRRVYLLFGQLLKNLGLLFTSTSGHTVCLLLCTNHPPQTQILYLSLLNRHLPHLVSVCTLLKSTNRDYLFR